MKRSIALLLTLIFGILVSGCMSVDTTVVVNRDGSGEIIEEIGLPRAFAEFTSAISEAGEGGQGPTLFDRGTFEDTAMKFGEGVRFVSMSEHSDDNMQYCRAVYAFDDVNEIVIDQNQQNRVPTGEEGSGNIEEPVSIRFATNGESSIVKIMLPENGMDTDGMSQSSPGNSGNVSDHEVEMMKAMFKGMHFGMKVVCNGDIMRTNATHVDGNAVTLFDLDFVKLIDQTDTLAKLNAAKPEGLEEAKELLKNIDGIKLEMGKEVYVQFR